MLTLTDNAASIVKSLADRSVGTDTGGLRIATAESDNTNFEVTVTPTPEAGDQVVENSGAHVFLEAHAADALSDKQLDAVVDDAGAVRFSIAERV
jgi:Fe-S cluster assembly iron-binding protein IscA